MQRVGIKVLKDKLSEYVRLAAGGEIVLVTDRDRVVAELVPPQPRHSEDEAAFNARGKREGWLALATVGPDDPLPPRRPNMRFDELMRDLDRSRED